jgi:hypothetical protein
MIIPAEALGWDPEVPFLGYIVRLVRPAIRAQEYYGFSCLFSVRVMSPALTDLELGEEEKRYIKPLPTLPQDFTQSSSPTSIPPSNPGTNNFFSHNKRYIAP